jgi:hypothetical protein
MDFNYGLISGLTVAFFLIPIIFNYLRIKKDFKFNFKSVTVLFNRSLIFQIIVGAILTLLFLVSGGKFARVLFSGQVNATFSMATVWFGVISVFYYLPSVLLLNILNWFVNRKQ